MFEFSKELCNKIKTSDCLEPKELQIVEMALRMWESYEEILNENLGLDRKKDFFQLEYAIHKNSLKK